jgi:uncharacterized protein YbjT (DUF2867 family)
MRTILTDGTGLIGSRLLDALTRLSLEMTVLDDFTSASRENITQSLRTEDAKLIISEYTNPDEVRNAIDGTEVFFHLAANPEVRLELNDPETCFHQNVYAIRVLLEAMGVSNNQTIVPLFYLSPIAHPRYHYLLIEILIGRSPIRFSLRSSNSLRKGTRRPYPPLCRMSCDDDFETARP